MVKFDYKKYITDTPDFPINGVIYRDISPLLKEKFTETIDAMIALHTAQEWAEVDSLAAIESRGFLFAAPIAYKLKKELVLIRKAGKLPNPTASIDFTLEYGQAVMEMHAGKGRIMLVDDVIATGGTLKAAHDLCHLAGFKVTQMLALIDIKLVKDFQIDGMKPRVLVEY